MSGGLGLSSTRKRTAERYDTSQLDVEGARVVARDYLAHCLRWGWAARFCSGRRVLDVGCGDGTPLAKVLRYTPPTRPAYYLGVDVKPVPDRARNEWAEVLDRFDFVERWPEVAASFSDEDPPFNMACCFEAIEHMSEADGRRLLVGIRACLADGGTMLLSTPVFDGHAARAHVHEWAAGELRGAIEAAGFAVEARHGTFSSYPVMRAYLGNLVGDESLNDPAAKFRAAGDCDALERLRAYYSDDVAACFLAPMYPDASRNCAWVCRAAGAPSC